MGPFRLLDLTGVDLSYTMAMEVFKETGDRSVLPYYSPPSGGGSRGLPAAATINAAQAGGWV